ncbi:MAG: type II toxin-antitoxin system VapC family toxin [Thermoanaerobaculales bacterium]|nr:type II toxin-antitoxin system VapC family toxin [Thermoanaerobaculales bacterium]
MRGFLLDTHIWLWSLLEPQRLVPPVTKALMTNGGKLWLSSISVWETTVLAEKRRIVLNRPTREWLSQALRKAPVHEAAITFEVATAAAEIELPHRDPADRLILATAKVFDLTLITADRTLLKQDTAPTLANR